MRFHRIQNDNRVRQLNVVAVVDQIARELLVVGHVLSGNQQREICFAGDVGRKLTNGRFLWLT